MNAEEARAAMLAKISGFKPQETIFEIGPKGKSAQNEAAEIVRTLRAKIIPRKPRQSDEDAEIAGDGTIATAEIHGDPVELPEDDEEERGDDWEEASSDSEDELEITVSDPKATKKASATWQDPEIFMGYTPRTINTAAEKAYGVRSGEQVNFVEAARDAAMDLTNDEGAKGFGEPTRAKMRWDKKQSKYVSRVNDEDGSGGATSKMIRGESGVKIAASFQSGRFDKWRKAQRLGKMPRVGEVEDRSLAGRLGIGRGYSDKGYKFKHKSEKAPKEADKYRDDYHVRKKRVAEARDKRIGKFRDGEGSKREVKGADDIRKAREIKEQKKAKNARPSKKPRRS